MATIFSTREINMQFRIKVFGIVDGKKINTLVGVSGLVRLIGLEMANKTLQRAFAGKDDACVCRLRRGVNVTYYVK